MNSKKYLIAMSLTIAAILCFVAGQPRFGFLSPRVADFGGLALILIAGLCWALPIGKKTDKEIE